MSPRSRLIKALKVLPLGLLLWTTGASPSPTELRTFIVPKGASAHEVAGRLKRDGLILHPWTFLIWMKLEPHGALRPGLYDLAPGLSGRQILKLFRQGPPLIKVTFPEGWTSQQMAALLDAKAVTPSASFLAIVGQKKLEGFLFPDTYFFERGMSAQAVIDRMVRRFHEMEPKDMAAQAAALHLSYRQIVILASIVEREARAAAERPLIAGVFYNRLRKHWRLESCATVEYALGKWKPKLTYKDLDAKSPYNTYRHGGLPPGPIGNPGAAALEAAAHPARTDMMFFVADGEGTHRFSRYYSQHLAAQGVKKRQK